jgi:hypothetical protein
LTDSNFEGPASVVVTSISAPNAALRELAQPVQGARVFVLPDWRCAQPGRFLARGCEFYSLARQQATALKIAELLPKRHYARKNIGYLLAMRTRSRMLLETDDDNMPLPGFWAKRQPEQRVATLAGTGWANVYEYFSDTNIWPRGLPLDAIQTPQPKFEALPVVESDCPIQQGLADGNPDVDAIYRLVLPLPIHFRTDRRVALGAGAWSPFNSQSTAWFPKAYPLLYLPSYCSFRMTDIWRSFVAQRIAWENGWSVLYTSPDVFQERNEHSLMRDFADEVPGYLHNRMIGSRLEALKLEAGPENMGENLIRCYEELIRLTVVDAKEMALVKAWALDIAELA